jgi:hypothetical protein
MTATLMDARELNPAQFTKGKKTRDVKTGRVLRRL